METESKVFYGAEIDWFLVSKAIMFYTNNGYEYIEVPWIVSLEAIRSTFDGEPLKSKEGCLVGSAEQSFVQMMIDGKLKAGRYIAATPCFRNEIYDNTHFPYFFKLELIHFLEKSLDDCICLSASFFNRYTSVSVVDTNIGKDLYVNDIEVGSYGVREFGKFYWTYGTGLAEPRFSIAVGNRNILT